MYRIYLTENGIECLGIGPNRYRTGGHRTLPVENGWTPDLTGRERVDGRAGRCNACGRSVRDGDGGNWKRSCLQRILQTSACRFSSTTAVCEPIL